MQIIDRTSFTEFSGELGDQQRPTLERNDIKLDLKCCVVEICCSFDLKLSQPVNMVSEVDEHAPKVRRFRP